MKKLPLIIGFCIVLLSACAKEEITTENFEQTIDTLIMEQQFGQAEIQIKNFLVKQPTSSSARGYLVLVLAMQGKYDNALQQYNRLDGKVGVKFLLPVLESLYFTGDNESAYELFDELFLQTGISEQANFTYALINARANRETLKLSELLDSDNLSPNMRKLVKGAIQLQAKESSELFQDAIKSIVSTKDDLQNWPVFQSLAANFYNSMGDYEAAEPYYLAYTKNRPQHFLVYLSIAELYLQTDQIDKASEQVDFILELSPDQPVGNQLKARVLLAQGKAEQAKTYLEKAIANGFASSANYLAAGTINFNLGNFERAISQLRVGLRNSQGYSKYHRMLDYALGRASNETANLPTIEDESDYGHLRSLLRGYVDSGNESGIEQVFQSIKQGADISPDVKFEQLLMESSLDDKNVELLVDLAEQLAIDNDQEFSVTREKAKIILISKLVDQNNIPEAVEQVKQWIDSGKTTPIDYLLLVDLYIKQGDLKQALKTTQAAPKNAVSPALLNRQSHIYAALGDKPQALLSIKKALAFNPYALPSLKQLVTLENDIKGSASDFASSIYPRATTVEADAIYLSMYKAMQQDFVGAAATLQALSQPARTSFKYYFLLSQHLISAGKTEEAKAAIKQVVDLKSVELMDSNNVLTTLSSLGLLNEKRLVLERLIESYPNSDTMKLELAKLLISMNKPNDALRILDKVSLSSEDKLNQIGIASRNLGELSAATKYFKMAYDIYTSQDSLTLYANHMYSLGMKDDATALLQSYISSHPKATDAMLLLAENANPEQQITIYKKILNVTPSNVMVLTNLAYSLNELNKTEEAKPYIEKALELAPNSAPVKATYDAIMK